MKLSNCMNLFKMKKKNRILDQKCLFWNLCLPIFKNYCRIWSQRSQITQNPKLFAEIKVLKFETKNTFLGIFRLEFEQTIFIFESRSFKFVKAPIFLWKQNIWFETKNASFEYFSINWKIPIVILEINTLEHECSEAKFLQKKKRNKLLIWDKKCLICIF